MTLLLLSGCATQSKKTYRQITMKEAITMMEEGTGFIILDVRAAQEYRKKNMGYIYIIEIAGIKSLPGETVTGISDKITEQGMTTGYNKAIIKKTGVLKYVYYQC